MATIRRRVEPAGPLAKPGLRLRLEERFGLLGDLRIVAYRGHGTRQSLHLRGRLLESRARTAGHRNGVLRNVLTALQRMESDEIPGARLVARFRRREYELFTDEEGYFQLNLYVDEPLHPGWHEVGIELVESVKRDARAHVRAEALVPSHDSEFAVVSDIDDTLVESSASDKLAQARLTLLHDGASRVPFDGVAALYGALVGGPNDRGLNPIFYLSRTGWNLYDLFIEFFEAHQLPRGPMFLRDLGVREKPSSALGSAHHKLTRIRELLQLYPTLPFVLIGDTGQHDAERYRQIAIEYPGRIRAVYLRAVANRRRHRVIEPIAEDLRRRGIPTVLGDDTLVLAEHMRKERLVSERAVQDVRRARRHRP